MPPFAIITKRDGLRLDDQMEVIAHQNPSENSPFVEIAHFPDSFNELISFEMIVEDELTARDAARDVVGRSWNEEARMSRHEIAPMRGRNAAILPLQPLDTRLC